jgi:hypothetical protein
VALKMGIKEGERRVEVFFYGLSMDEELLRGKGLEPEGGEIAAIDGFALRIGQRAALVQSGKYLTALLCVIHVFHPREGLIPSTRPAEFHYR